MSRKNYGWRPDLRDSRDFYVHDYLTLSSALPASQDLRPLLMPCYNQGQAGSCTGNATAGALELDEIIQGAEKVTPSRLFLYWGGRAQEGTTKQDAGAMIRDVVAGVAKWGYCHESYWPYDVNNVTVCPTKEAYGAAYSHKLNNYMYARVSQTLPSLKQVLFSNRGVIFGFTVYESFEHIGSDGLMPLPQSSESVLGGHAVLMVGYDDARRVFIVRNSWGTDWGDGGYFYMPYDYALSRLASDFWVITRVPRPA